MSSVLSEFARTLVTDFPIQAILDHLVMRIVDVLPVTAAGVTLISPGMKPRFVAASDDAALRFERLQTDVGEGPCLLAYETGEAVAVPELSADELFPHFTPLALAAGLAAVFTFPLRFGEQQFGALDLYRSSPGVLAPRDMTVAQTLADVTSAYLLNAEARHKAREVSDRYRESALHDALTGLPNRVLLTERIEHAGLRAQRSRTAVAVLFVDLDRFKDVNDEYGHQCGDELLVAVAGRLTKLLRPGDTLARLSGDEFVVLCEDLKHPTNVDLLVTRIHDALDHPFDLWVMSISMSASVGIAYAGQGQDISTGLIQRADAAMYEMKNAGGGQRRIRDIRSHARVPERAELGQDVRAALARDELTLAYQPIVRSHDGLVTGVEALLRWTDRTRGAVPAEALMAVADHTDLMTAISAWVLRRACTERLDLIRAGGDQRLDLTVNVSAQQLMARGFRTEVATVLEETGTEPGALILDLTEESFLDDPDRARTVLGGLKALGVRVALDDFGTGFSALNHLRVFPVDIVKIDRSAVAEIRGGVTSPIITAVIDLSHGLGLSVVAEGVENREQHDRVIDLGAEAAQGYFFAPPMKSSELALRLENATDRLLRLPC